MIISFLLLAVLFSITHITGYALLNYLSKKHQTAYDPQPGLTNVLALAVISVIIGIYHLFFKVQGAWIFIVFAILYAFLSKAVLIQTLQALRLKKTILAGLFLAATISLVSRPGTGDIADYHLQAILWAEKYPNILGLGNFNRPLANNNWWFNLQALFGLKNIHLYPLNALMFIAAMLFLILDKPANIFLQAYKIPLLFFIALSTKTAFVGSVTPDYIVTLLIFIVSYIFIRFWFVPNDLDVYLLLVLAAFAVCIKLNAILLVPFAWYAFFNYYKKNLNIKNLIAFVVLHAIFFIPWIAGNIIVSGWLAYPVDVIDLFDVDWKVPKEILEFERFSIKQWGKIQGNDIYETAKLSFAEWFPVWFSKNDWFNKTLIVGLPILTLASLFFLSNNHKRLYFILMFFGIAGMIFCFSNGPHIRYAYGYIFTALSTAFAIIYIKFINIRIRGMNVVFVFISLIPVLIKLFNWQQQSVISNLLVTPPPYQSSLAQPIKLKNETVYITKNNNDCWVQFPCSYYMVNGCTLRGETIEHGFKTSNNENK